MVVVGKQCSAGLGCMRREAVVSLFGGWPIITIYEQRMGLEPKVSSFGHWINSHL